MIEERFIESNLECVGEPTEAGAVAALALAAGRPVDVYKGDTRRVVALAGKLHTIEHERPPRAHKAHSVDALVAHATEHSAVWHHGDAVKLVVDNREESHRHDVVAWALTRTEAWAEAVRQRDGMKQAELIELMTGALRKPVIESPQATAVLDRIRALKFSTTDDEDQQRTKGSASMGREIQSKVVGADNIPEDFTIAVRRWAELDVVETIELCVAVDPERRLIRLRATRDEVAAVEESAQAKLGAYLSQKLNDAGTGTPVYAGEP